MFKKWRQAKAERQARRQAARNERVSIRNNTKIQRGYNPNMAAVTGGLGAGLKAVASGFGSKLGGRSGANGNTAVGFKNLSDGQNGQTGGQPNMLWYAVGAAILAFLFKDKLFGR